MSKKSTRTGSPAYNCEDPCPITIDFSVLPCDEWQLRLCVRCPLVEMLGIKTLGDA